MSETSGYKKFKKKWDNWWYHYKFQSWIGIFIVFCVIATVYYSISSVEPDLTVTYVGNSARSEVIETALTENFANEIVELQNDKEKNVLVKAIYVRDDLDLQGNLFNMQQLDLDIATAASDFFIVDKFTYEFLKGRNYFEPAFNGQEFIDISNNKLFYKGDVDFSDKYLCVRIKTMPESKQNDYEKRLETVENIVKKTLAK